MTNDLNNISQQINETTMNSAKKWGELQHKTFDRLVQKQTNWFKAMMTLGTKHFEAATKARTLNDLMAVQQATLQATSETWMASLKDTQEMLTEVQGQYIALAQEAMTQGQQATEKTWAASQKVAQQAVASSQGLLDKAVLKSAANEEKLEPSAKKKSAKAA